MTKQADADGTAGTERATGSDPTDGGLDSSTLGTDAPPASTPAKDDKDSKDDSSDDVDFGRPGPPINRNGPFYFGFVGAIGVLLAWNLLKLIASLSAVL